MNQEEWEAFWQEVEEARDAIGEDHVRDALLKDPTYRAFVVKKAMELVGFDLSPEQWQLGDMISLPKGVTIEQLVPPACKTCKWWGVDTYYCKLAASYGQYGYESPPFPESLAHAQAQYGYNADLWTAPNFYCCQWEKKA